MSNEIAVKKPTVAQFLGSVNVKKYIEGVLKERAPQFVTSLVSMANITPSLKNCVPETLMYCGLKAASLNLPLDNNLGFAYAIPFKRKVKNDKNVVTGEVTEAQFMLGYRAFVQLGQRTGLYKVMNVIDIHKGELISWDPFTEVLELELNKDLVYRAKLDVIGYAGVFELMNGFKKVSYWPKERVTAHAQRFSKTFNNGPWQSDFNAMARKTVLKDMLNHWGPMSTEIAQAVKFDQSVIRKDDDGEEYPDYVDIAGEELKELPENSIDAEFKAEQERKASLELDAKIAAMEDADAKVAGKEGK
ncbi:MAG TPA: recombinase RecT [Desulfosporosinus sp.]|nr:recombinase RecT [Desulfosporosinus sp.]